VSAAAGGETKKTAAGRRLSILGAAKRPSGGEKNFTTNNGHRPVKTIEPTITGHEVVSRDEWIAARKGLLIKEKEQT
jgi:hypothetical protein